MDAARRAEGDSVFIADLLVLAPLACSGSRPFQLGAAAAVGSARPRASGRPIAMRHPTCFGSWRPIISAALGRGAQ